MKLYHKELGACHGDDLLYLFPFAVPGFPNNLKTEHGQVRQFELLLKYLTPVDV